MAEGVEGLIGAVKIPGFILCIRVDVGTAGVLGVVVDGHLAKVPGEGDGEFSGRVVISEQDIGHSVAAHGAGIPGLKDCIGILGLFAEVQRTAVKEHQGNGFSLLLEGFEKLCLLFG